ncbi:sugar nucleotidyltransferase [Candidatus Pelagibacter bacterium nBUS_25]|uniref:sugar nucleotidyltransferase n=1 Tax=Candidatus Pelagibacter bacterium nBUS_25 TaxID=3374187 RepID=UPI003EC03FEA
MKGIILAGGNGTRFKPATLSISKHLLQVYDKPMIYYSLSLLFLSKIRDILLICKSEDLIAFQNLLGDGSYFGIKISYEVQDKPNGIAEALIIGEKFIGKNNFCLILGDNFFFGHRVPMILQKASKNILGANILTFESNTPQDFGVIYFDKNQKPLKIIEKPKDGKSNSVIPGIYFYTPKAIKYAKQMDKSARGELEISDLNKIILNKKKLKVFQMGRGIAWLDMGDPERLNAASNFVRSVQTNQGFLISCLEEIALNNKWIKPKKLKQDIEKLKLSTDYYKYIMKLLSDKKFK